MPARGSIIGSCGVFLFTEFPEIHVPPVKPDTRVPRIPAVLTLVPADALVPGAASPAAVRVLGVQFAAVTKVYTPVVQAVPVHVIGEGKPGDEVVHEDVLIRPAAPGTAQGIPVAPVQPCVPLELADGRVVFGVDYGDLTTCKFYCLDRQHEGGKSLREGH